MNVKTVDCNENFIWATAEGNGGRGWKCIDYISNKWCENGGIGSGRIGIIGMELRLVMEAGRRWTRRSRRLL